MAPAGGDTSDKNAEITMQLRLWAKRDGTGRTFDSSGGFVLPNGATRSPDASWVRHGRLAALTAEERAKFLPLCPDFVIELRSLTDGLSALQDKMREYMENGAQLGWLIDPVAGQVFVYRPGAPVERLEGAGQRIRRPRAARIPPGAGRDPVVAGFRLGLPATRGHGGVSRSLRTAANSVPGGGGQAISRIAVPVVAVAPQAASACSVVSSNTVSVIQRLKPSLSMNCLKSWLSSFIVLQQFPSVLRRPVHRMLPKMVSKGCRGSMVEQDLHGQAGALKCSTS